jgi:Ras-related protein Rab-2A
MSFSYQENKDCDYLFRYIIVGDVSVGKSCIMLRFSSNQFREEHELTIGVEFAIKFYEIKNKNIKIQIWDTAGEEAFQSITKNYYKNAIGALLVYDITKKSSFDHLKNWLDNIRENSSRNIKIILIGNKTDLEDKREVTFEEGEEFAKNNGLFFLETSAKNFTNINESFNKLTEEIYDNIEILEEEEESKNSIKLEDVNSIINDKKKCKC